LAKRGILTGALDLNGVFYSNDVESNSHLFFSCPFSRNLWRSVSNWMGIQDVHHVEGVQHFLMHGNVVVGV
jgi:hypothetical protein